MVRPRHENPPLRTSFLALAAAVVPAIAACSASSPAIPWGDAGTDGGLVVPGSSHAPGAGAGGDGLPCDVSRVLGARCQKCHASSPVAGAPMPLVTYADTQRPSKTKPDEAVWQRMKSRLHDASNPMPPDGPLDPADLAALDAWIDGGAKPGTSACGAAPDAGAPVASGPSALPCPPSEQRTFLAHGDGPGGKFHVAKDAGNEYACFTWRTPFASPTQATAFAPVIDDARVVHHWILYKTATAQPDGAFGPCSMPADAQFVSGWAPGGGNTVLPPNVGQDLRGKGDSFILQLHYWNVAGYDDANDASGVAVCTTTTPRPETAAVVTLGTLGISIPPHASDVTATATCTDKATAPLHIINAAPHMHMHGTSFRTDIWRGGDPTRSETLVDVPRWDFNSQTGHPVDMMLNPGDVLRTQCHYRNDGDTTISFGERTEDEMCFDFVTVWPVSAITSIFGPVTYCND